MGQVFYVYKKLFRIYVSKSAIRDFIFCFMGEIYFNNSGVIPHLSSEHPHRTAFIDR